MASLYKKGEGSNLLILILKFMFWKIYYYFFIFIFISAYINLSLQFNWGSTFRIWELINLPFMVLLLVGLHAFVWKKKIFSINFWKVFFFISLIWGIYYLYIVPIPTNFKVDGVSQFSSALLSTILNAPLAVAIFLYSFKRKKI